MRKAKIRLIAGLALLLASIPPAPPRADAAEAAGKLCRAYCELVNMICQAGAVPTGDEEPCLHLYRGCVDGCDVEA